MRRSPIAALILLPLGWSVLANAQSSPTVCAAAPAPPPPELAGWSNPSPATAGASKATLAGAALTPGTAVKAVLLAGNRIRHAAPPERVAKAGTFGGLFTFTVRQAGQYRIALGSAAWVDIVRRGKRIASTAHGHGPDCTGIRKMVDFPLQSGTYVLQISGSEEPAIRLLVARLP